MMKKIYLLTLTGLMVTALSAQRLTSETGTPSTTPFVDASVNWENRAIGDTLLYIPLPEYLVNPTDQPTFNLQVDDQDGYTVQSGYATIWTSGSGWITFYDDTPGNPAIVQFDTDYHADTAFYLAATSWFATAAQADDWFSFGPLTVPASGATLKWRYQCSQANFCDGYRVLVNGTGLDPVADFGSEIIYTKADVTAIGPSTPMDTVWNYYTASIPSSYNGSQVYIGFNHNANDMNIIFYDEFMVIEGGSSGVEGINAEGYGMNSIMPNPVSDYALIPYAVGNNVKVDFTVTDINGRVITKYYEGGKSKGNYVFNMDVTPLSSGMYYVTMNAGQYSTTQKMIVSK